MNAEERTAFVVGVDHRIQYTNADCGPEWTSEIQAFEDYLVDEATKHDVDVLAEEFSQEQVQRNNATGCTVRDAAKRAHKRPLFLDPDTSERAALGISTGDQLTPAAEPFPSRLERRVKWFAFRCLNLPWKRWQESPGTWPARTSSRNRGQ